MSSIVTVVPEQHRLAELRKCERIVKAGLTAAYEVGSALRKVRDQKLWEADSTLKNFEAWAGTKFNLSRSQAYNLIGHADAVDSLSGDPETPAPTTVRQTVPLAGLPAEQKRETWKEAVAESGGNPTGEDVKRAAARRKADAKLEARVEAARESGVILGEVEVARDAEEEPELSAEGSDAEGAGGQDGEPGEDAGGSDESWLASLPLSGLLSGVQLERFQAEALAFRRFSEFRRDYAMKCRPHGEKAKKKTKGHIGPYLYRHYGYLKANDPSRWKLCEKCNGDGEFGTFGKCPDCRGEGYTV